MTHDGWTFDRAFGEIKRYGYNSGIWRGVMKEFVFRYARVWLLRSNRHSVTSRRPAPASGESVEQG